MFSFKALTAFCFTLFFFACSGENVSNSTIEKQKETASNSAFDSKLSNKVWYVIGDSFSHGDWSGINPEPTITEGIYKGELPVYPYLIGNRTGCIVKNIAVSGTTLSVVDDRSFSFPKTGKLYKTDFSSADLITIYYGINDSHNKVPIGSIDDTDVSTFYGAYNTTIKYLTEKYPKAKIGIIVSNDCETADYPNATVAVAEKWGIPYLDLDGGIGCQTVLGCSSRNPASDEEKMQALLDQRVSTTNGHPNELGHQIVSECVENWINEFL